MSVKKIINEQPILITPDIQFKNNKTHKLQEDYSIDITSNGNNETILEIYARVEDYENSYPSGLWKALITLSVSTDDFNNAVSLVCSNNTEITLNCDVVAILNMNNSNRFNNLEDAYLYQDDPAFIFDTKSEVKAIVRKYCNKNNVEFDEDRYYNDMEDYLEEIGVCESDTYMSELTEEFMNFDEQTSNILYKICCNEAIPEEDLNMINHAKIILKSI